MKKIKKIGLGVASLGGLVIPLTLFASCSSQTANVNYKIIAKSKIGNIYTSDIENDGYKSFKTLSKLFQDLDQLYLDNLSIIFNGDPTTSSKATITLVAKSGNKINGEESLTSKEFSIIQSSNLIIDPKISPVIFKTDIENNQYKRLETLQKVFLGINQNKLDNMGVRLEGNITNESNHTIILTANEGYTINGETTLSSDFFKIANKLNVKPIIETPTDITHLDIKDNNYKNILVLQKLFSNINQSDLKNLDISISGNPNKPLSKHVITLKAHENFIFIDDKGNSVNTIESMEFTTVAFDLVLNPIEAAALSFEDLESLNNGINDINYLTNLEKLFTGIDDTNIDFFTSEADLATRIVTLTAKEGFTINQQPDLISEQFNILLEINKASSMETLDLEDIRTLQNGEFNLLILEKLFDGINENNISFIESARIDLTTRTVTLTTKEGYIFNENDNSKIEIILVQNIPLGIINKEAHIILDTNDIQNLEDGLQIDDLVILQKLFDGIDETNIGFIEIATIDLTTRKVTLVTKEGYSFSDINLNKLTSSNFTILLDIKIKTEEPMDITHLDIKGENYKSMMVLEKLFIDITKEDRNKIEIGLISETLDILLSNHSITLKANDGFIFSDGSDNYINTINSVQFTTTSVDLKISAKEENHEQIYVNDIENNEFKTLNTLEKLFNGINESHLGFNLFQIILIPKSIRNNEFGILLTTDKKHGYTINGNNTWGFSTFKMSLDIKTENVSASLSINDLINLEKWRDVKFTTLQETLNKLFIGFETIQEVDFKSIISDIKMDWDSKTITLIANAGFIFSETSIDALNSKAFTFEKISLNITPITGERPITEEDIRNLKDKNQSNDLEVLVKLFDGIEQSHLDVWSIGVMLDEENSKILLNAGEGFIFNNEKNISATFTVFLPIDAKPEGEITLVLADIGILSDENSDEHIDVLDRLFNGITKKQLDSGIISFKLNSNKTITLNAHKYFSFKNGSKTIEAEFQLEENIELSVSVNPRKIPLTSTEIAVLDDKESGAHINVLKKLFIGITKEQLDNKIVTFKLNDDKKSVTLWAHDAFTFANNLPDITADFKQDLEISPLANVILSQADFNLLNDEEQSNDLLVLKKLFNKLDETNINNVEVGYEPESEQVTLIAKEGFTFANKKEISVTFMVDQKMINLNIDNKSLKSTLMLSILLNRFNIN